MVRSKFSGGSDHRRYLDRLLKSGLDRQEMNRRWQNYYANLSPEQKAAVWQDANQLTTTKKSKKIPGLNFGFNWRRPQGLTWSQHAKSVVFGLVVAIVLFITYQFTFFNERYITPFLRPSSVATETQVIITPDAPAKDGNPRIIIPKINIEVPIVYQLPQGGDLEARIQAGLQNGVVHYPNTQLPGQAGHKFNSNVVIVGHSSANQFNAGNFKYAFMHLSKLDVGDIFIINHEGRQYVYKVYEEKIVPPTEVGVLGPAEQSHSVTLITCDPPGTTTNRLIVIGRQINPSPNEEIRIPAPLNNPIQSSNQLPGDPQTLGERLRDGLGF